MICNKCVRNITIIMIVFFCLSILASQTRPNIVFIFSDDQSWPHAGAYGDSVVRTPIFDKIAKQGVLFNNAFVASPSCSPSRAAVLTGRNIWELKSASNLHGVFPDSLLTYPKILQDAGYEVGKRGKGWGPGRSDVSWAKNPAGASVATFASFYNNRDTSKPFCYWFGSTNPHRPYAKGEGLASGKNPDKVVLPKFLPDSPEIRSDILDYYQEIESFDKEAKEVYETLLNDGALQNTMIVISSDNGMPFPRAKANLYDGGTRVPLAIMWQGKIPAGRVVDDFVNLMDLAPTYLEAAGEPIPQSMTGKSFYSTLISKSEGWVDNTRDRVYMARERHTSARDNNYGYPSRAIRTKEYLYIWNIHSERWPAGNPNGYEDVDGSPSKEWMLSNRTPTDKNYFELAFGTRPEHELYDLKRDPHQLKNAAYNGAYIPIRDSLRKMLETYLRKTKDPHLVGNGADFETYPQVRTIRDIKPVTPTTPYIDSLQGNPTGTKDKGFFNPYLSKVKWKKTVEGWTFVNKNSFDVVVHVYSLLGNEVNSKKVSAFGQVILRNNKETGLFIVEIKRGKQLLKSPVILI